MRKLEKNLLIIAVVIIVAALVLALGAYISLQSGTDEMPLVVENTPSETVATTNNRTGITDAMVVAAIEQGLRIRLVPDDGMRLYIGTFEGSAKPEYYMNTLARGDLNADGYEDAVAWGTTCGASCGSVFSVVINESGTSARMLQSDLPHFLTSGAAQFHVEGVTIAHGRLNINVEIPHFDGTSTRTIMQYRYNGREMELIESAPQASAATTYYEPLQVWVNDQTPDGAIVDVFNLLTIKKKDSAKIEYALFVNGSNFHICSHEGVATRVQPNRYEETVSFSEESCTLRIEESVEGYVVEKVEGSSCRFMCGARAHIDSHEFDFIHTTTTPAVLPGRG
jgi:hypothetical protein